MISKAIDKGNTEEVRTVEPVISQPKSKLALFMEKYPSNAVIYQQLEEERQRKAAISQSPVDNSKYMEFWHSIPSNAVLRGVE